MSYEDRRKSFVQYLKEHQKNLGMVPAQFIDSLSDDDIMLSYRKSPEDGKDLYSEEQERSILMEFDSDETIHICLEKMKKLNHIDDMESEMIKDKESLIPITIADIDQNKLKALIKGFKSYGIKLEMDELEAILEVSCAFFAKWILEGREYFIAEPESLKFIVAHECQCPGCFLHDTLSRYRTLAGWSGCTDSMDVDPSYKTLRRAQTKLLELIFESIINIVDPEEVLAGNRKFEKLLDSLNTLLVDYIMPLPLTSCWMRGKEVAIQSIAEKEESIKFLYSIHERFHSKYESSIERGTTVQFFKDLEAHLKTLSKSQLLTLYVGGFPIEKMPRRHHNKIDKVLKTLIDGMERDS